MMGYFRERLKHAVRFRHKRGYGVHSPFMFRLILDVIRDKRSRYAYPLQAEQLQGIRLRERKLCRLAYRLCSYLEFRTVLCLTGETESVACYLTGNPDVREVKINDPGAVEETAFIYIGKEAQEWLEQIGLADIEPRKEERKCVLITDIYRSSHNLRLWRLLKARATVSVDMMWYGVLLFDEKLQKGHYHLTI